MPRLTPNPRHRAAGTRYAIAAALLLAILMPAASAQATTHLIKSMDSWDAVASKLKPGDEVVLMPGKHRPISLQGLAGTHEQPILVRGLSPTAPAVIAADRFGLELHRCQHIVVQDIAISGATIHGIAIDDEPRAEDGQPFNANIILRNLKVEETGPKGQRDAISLSGVTNVQINSSVIEGWAGAAVNMVACSQITLDALRTIALEDHTQFFGVTMRAGCAQIMIKNSRFEKTANAGIFVGGTTDLTHFRPAIPDVVSPGSVSEVSGLIIDHCLFLHCTRPFDFAHAADWSIRQNTIVRPVDLILSLRLEQQSDKFNRGGRGMLGLNLMIWEPGELTRLALVDESINLRNFQLGRNLLWSTDTPEDRGKLGALPQSKTGAEQVTDLDPHLDENFTPQMPPARVFGWGGGGATASAQDH